jgi:hypothetical protein
MTQQNHIERRIAESHGTGVTETDVPDSGIVSAVLAPSALRTTTYTGTGLDFGFDNGLCIATLLLGAITGTGATLAGKIQESTNNSSWTDVSGGGFSNVTSANANTAIVISFNRTKQYLRFLGTITGTSPNINFSVHLQKALETYAEIGTSLTSAYTDSGTTLGTVYQYRVRNENAGGQFSDYCTPIYSWAQNPPVLTNPDWLLTAADIQFPALTGATGYTVNRSTNNGAFSDISGSVTVVTGGGTSSFTDTGPLDPLSSYQYKVQAKANHSTTTDWSTTFNYPARRVTFDASASSGYSASSSTISFNHICSGSNGLLIVDIGRFTPGAVTITSVKYNGVSMTSAVSTNDSSKVTYADSYVLAAPAVGTHSVDIVFSGAVNAIALATSYNGAIVSQFDAVNLANAVNSGAADATVTVSSYQNYDAVHSVVVSNAPAVTDGAGYTGINNVTSVSGSVANEYKLDVAASTPTVSFSGIGAGKAWSILAMAIVPLGGTQGGGG